MPARPSVCDVGDLIRIWGIFMSPSGVDTDPTTVVCKFQAPDGTETTKTFGADAEVVKFSIGRYYLDLDITAAGTWYYRWNGTGDVKAAGEQALVARETQF